MQIKYVLAEGGERNCCIYSFNHHSIERVIAEPNDAGEDERKGNFACVLNY